MRRVHACALILVASGVAALAACTPSEPAATPTPSASASPEPTQSDAEVEAEAVEVVNRFMALADESLTTHEVPYDEMREVASTQVISLVNADVQIFVDAGYRLQGITTVENPRLTDRSAHDELSPDVAEVLACLDASTSTVLDASGQLVPGGGVPRRVISLELTRENETLRISAVRYPDEPEGALGCEP